MIMDMQKNSRNFEEDEQIFVNYRLSNRSVLMSFKQERKIKANAFSLTGAVKSIKRNELVEFESSLERDYIHILENDKNVRIYYEQPLKIFFPKGVYIPDFLVEYNDGSKEIVEIKYRDDLRQNFSKYKEKFRGAVEFCSYNGINFRIYTEKEIRTPYLANVKFLSNFIDSHIENDYSDLTALRENLRKLKRTTPRELVEFTSKDLSKQAELIYLLWHMVYNGSVGIDLSLKLTMNSVITT